jgi:1,4-dihydroxy-2-naphthoate octaprenyltransferase
MIFQGYFNVTLALIMIISLLFAIFYIMPPFRLIWSGYGELILSILIGFFIPSFAFILQYGQLHRFIPMMAFSLVLLFLSGLIVSELPTYARDLKHERRNLVVRMGWDRAMNLHNLLILFTFLLFAFASFFGFPLFALLSGLLSLPLGLLQLYQIYRIQHGAKPSWKSFLLLSKLLVLSFAYFISFSFWMH